MRKTEKKLCALLLAASMAALTACGGGSGSAGSGSSAAPAGTAAAGETQAPVAEGESVSQETDIVAAVNVDFTTMDPMDTSDTLSGGKIGRAHV